jgi:hypothetical protein
MSGQSTIDTREKITLIISGAIVVTAVVYWVLQVLDVMATLRMAYGG